MVSGGSTGVIAPGGTNPVLGLYKAKQMIQWAFIGYIVILIAWLLVNTFLDAIGVAQWTNIQEQWNVVQVDERKKPITYNRKLIVIDKNKDGQITCAKGNLNDKPGYSCSESQDGYDFSTGLFKIPPLFNSEHNPNGEVIEDRIAFRDRNNNYNPDCENCPNNKNWVDQYDSLYLIDSCSNPDPDNFNPERRNLQQCNQNDVTIIDAECSNKNPSEIACGQSTAYKSCDIAIKAGRDCLLPRKSSPKWNEWCPQDCPENQQFGTYDNCHDGHFCNTNTSPPKCIEYDDERILKQSQLNNRVDDRIYLNEWDRPGFWFSHGAIWR